MGRNKALEIFGSSNLVLRVLSRLSHLNSDIILVTSSLVDRPYDQLRVFPALKIVADVYPGKGPLGGLYAGLLASDTPLNLVVACDMPFLNLRLLRYMLKLGPDFDVVVPRIGGYFEPLHAVYSQKCVAPVKDLLERQCLNVRDLFTRVSVRFLDAAEIDRFDPEHISFFNINTEIDLARAKALIRADRDQELKAASHADD